MAVLFVGIIFLSACGTEKKDYNELILGAWTYEEYDRSRIFYDDGTFFYEVGGDQEGYWSILNGDYLKLDYLGTFSITGTDTYKIISLSSDELILESEEDGERYIYHKVSD